MGRTEVRPIFSCCRAISALLTPPRKSGQVSECRDITLAEPLRAAVRNPILLLPSIFSDDMAYVLVVFLADIFHQLFTLLQRGVSVHGERLRVCAGIVNRRSILQMPQIRTRE